METEVNTLQGVIKYATSPYLCLHTTWWN